MNKLKNVVCVLIAISFAIISVCRKNKQPEESTDCDMTIYESTSSSFDADEYKTTIKNCVSELSQSVSILDDFINYEYNYWNALNNIGGTITAEKIVSHAEEWINENKGISPETIDEQFDSIAAIYREIVSTEIEGAEAEEIREVFKELYDAYIGMYNAAVSPSGDITSFNDKCNTYAETIKISLGKLEILIP